MFIDYRDTSAPAQIDCDLCIIGAGAAGITMARALTDSGIHVCVLESGGFEQEEQTQNLYAGESVGLTNADPLACRLRTFGGTTMHWGGWCAPLHEHDFQVRSWVPDSGWPIQYNDLKPYYEQAQKVCEIGPFKYGADAFLQDTHKFPPFHPDKIDVGFFQYSPPTRFGTVYKDELARARNVDVILHANVTRIKTDKSASRVTQLHIQTLEGRTGSVKAKIFVLACGGMENARMLLLANDIEKNGLGNRSGLVGKYFLQHVEIGAVGRIVSKDPKRLFNAFRKYTLPDATVAAEMRTSVKAQEKNKYLNCAFTLLETEWWDGAWDKTGYDSLREAWRQVKNGNLQEDFTKKLWSVVTDLDSAVEGSYKQMRDLPYDGELKELVLWGRSEQSPNINSRVDLGSDLDHFGLRKIRVNWQLTEFDKRSVRSGLRTIAEELGRLNLGRMQVADWLMADDTSWAEPVWGGCHHMGTTRMSDDPKAGVVDRNCRSHSVQNLYVAGSSVFPTTGYVPPTLTIVSLALRLAEHLKQQLPKG